MYVTRPLSLYKKFPASLSLPPPEGPNSGYLVIQDEESETTSCFGLCKDHEIWEPPIPQNKNHIVRHSSPSSEPGQNNVSHDYVIFIPVLNQPLSSNRYYVIQARGKHTGEAYKNSKEEDMAACCFCNFIQDAKPIPLNSHDLYQQFEICQYKRRGYFTAKSIAPDGFPPSFLRRKGWGISTETPKNYELGEALGLDTALRACLPEFNFPLSCKTSETIEVGKWYCPFMFIKEERKLKDQMKISMYYEMTLEQRWEQIFACENNSSIGNAVAVDVIIQKEAVTVAGRKAGLDASNVVDGVKWFRSAGSGVGGEVSVGLSIEVVERMNWEQQRAGWVDEEDGQVKVERVEEFKGGNGGWQKFGCYVLVERFVLKRMDGSLVLTHDFKHTHQIRSKWD